MQKFKIILINIVAIIVILTIADFVFFEIEKRDYLKECETSNGFFSQANVTHFVKNIPTSYVIPDEKRSFDKKSAKSILLLGCSFTYGAGLEPEQTFSYYLSKQTGRTVYNLGISGGSIQQALYLTGKEDFGKKYPNVDLVIYTFISDHLNRNNEFLRCNVFKPYCNFRLVKKGDNYVKADEWYAFPSKIFLFRFFLEGLTSIKNSQIFYKKNCETFVDMVNRTEKNLKEKYPDAKFVFFFYHCEKNPLLIDNFNKDIYVLSTEDLENLDLEDKKYRHGNDWHPSEKAWPEIVPKLTKKLHEINCL